MPLSLPSIDEIVNRIRADIKQELPASDPYAPASLLNAISTAFGNRMRELFDIADDISRDTFSATAEGQALIDRAADYGLTILPGSRADGIAVFTGTATTVVPINTPLQQSNGQGYKTDAELTLSTVSVTLSSLTRIGTTATAATASDHGLCSGMTVMMAGAVETDYNGDFEITVTSSTTFTYTVAGSPSTPATGTITASYDGGAVAVTSDEIGQDANVSGGATLVLTNTISGVDNTVYTQYSGIDGGADNETADALRERLLLKQRNPETPFNETNIKLEAFKVAGVTRVWVYEPDEVNDSQTATSLTASGGFVLVDLPASHGLYDGMQITVSGANESAFNGTFRVIIIGSDKVGYYSASATGTATGTVTVAYSNIQLGQVRIFFARDDDESIIPSASEIQDVKDQVLTIKPANTADIDVIVEAPTEVSNSFSFSAISPDTSGMRASIEANLQNLFDGTDIGATITELQYLTAIQNSYDSSSGQVLSTFTLSSPSGNLTSEYNEILTLGTVSF